MAQATLEDAMSREAALSVAFIITRNDDPFTLALRRGDDPSNDNLRQLSRASSSASTSVASTSTTESYERSVITKPTSYGTSYPAHDYIGDGKADTTYAASLSATHGSESEADVELDDGHCIALLGTGAWSSGRQAHEQCLRKSENAKIRASKIRLSKTLPHRLKKPPVDLHHTSQDVLSACQDKEQRITARAEADPICPRHHIPYQHYALLGLVGATVLTTFFGGLKIYHTDPVNIMSLRRIVMAFTSAVAIETVLTVLVAGRTLLEASLLGLFPLIIGSMFLMAA